MEEAITNLQVMLLDHTVGPYSEEKLIQLEKDWILNLGTSGPTGVNTKNSYSPARDKIGATEKEAREGGAGNVGPLRLCGSVRGEEEGGLGESRATQTQAPLEVSSMEVFSYLKSWTGGPGSDVLFLTEN